MGKKQPYYDNNWDLYKSAPDDFFIQHTFEELMEWKVAGWELPATVCCVIRVQNQESKKVKEHVYRSAAAAKRKVKKLMTEEDIEFTVCDHQSIHHLFPENSLPIEDESDDI